MKVNKLTLNSRLLPKDFGQMADPPKQLFFRGTLQDFAQKPRVAIVGSRKVTPYGREVTEKLASELADRGVAIISGLALGVDSIAHQSALDARGTTVAVLGCGIDKIYPSSHTQLGSNILKHGGAIISEYPEGTGILPYQFIARNRIISGLSDAVLVTEAAEKSGSLHTANFALDQGKTVLAVPGNINSPSSVGTNNLIKSGAIPVTGVNDVLMAIGLAGDTDSIIPMGSNVEETAILKLIAEGTTDISELLILSKLDPAVFNQTLSMLEITGKIRSLGAGHFGIQ